MPLLSKKSEWEIVWEGPISYHVDVIFSDIFGAVGIAHWIKQREIKEERSVIKRWFCCECNECGCSCGIKRNSPIIESRYRIHVLEHFPGTAYRISQGYNLKGGDFWWSVNPWTGKTMTGRMPPGP